MKKELNKIIAAKGFNRLILDYVFPADPVFNLPEYASGRVLCDGWYAGHWTAKNEDEAVEAFMAGTLDY